MGDREVGKTSLVRRYAFDEYTDGYLSTVGAKITKAAIRVRQMNMEETLRVEMTIWDVMGDFAFFAGPIYHYLRGTQGIIGVCDITNHKSLSHLDYWIDTAFKFLGPVPVHIVANKFDLLGENEIDAREVQFSSEAYGDVYLFTSAKSGMNVGRCFEEVTLTILRSTRGKSPS